MCIICHKPENNVLAEHVIDNMWHNNPDGAGFMYAENGKLHIQKGLMSLSDFKAAYEPHKEKEAVLHFRIRTHGKTDAEMTHPFSINDSLAFVHNGIINGLGNNTHSDTWYFNENYLKPLSQDVQSFLHISPITTLIKDKIGGSKLVFMDQDGNVTIINEHLGVRSSDGFWFSNSSWNYEKKITQQTHVPWYKTGSTNEITGSTTNIIPFTNGNKYKIPTVGDLVYLTAPYGEYLPGELGIFSYYKAGFYGGISFSNGVKEIPTRILEVGTFVELEKKVGHFVPGTKLLFIQQEQHSTRVYLPENKKMYRIPNSSYKFIDQEEAWDILPANVLQNFTQFEFP
jgi:hypothetical protein